MPAANELPPIGIEDYQSYQSDQFGQTTDAMLATLDKPPAPTTPPIVADQADRATPPTPPAPALPDAASITSPIDASASPPAAPAAPAMAPAQPAPPPAPDTPAAPPSPDDLSPALNAASAAGVDPGVFIAAHQSGHVDPNNWFDSATQLAGHIKDAGGDLVQGLAAFTGSATNAAKVLDRAVANLNPAPVATTPDNSAQGATQTTAELSGGGKAAPLGDAAHTIMSAAANSAAWLGEQGQKALQAILVTEGGMTGARGDQGNSAGPLQFYSGGQLANFAQQHGMTQDAAKTYVEAHPAEAVAWAIGSPDHPGYLGSALAAGLQKGLSGPALATYGQQHGQVSVSPERAGQNWNALFGNGSGPFTTAASTTLSTNPSTANSVSQFGDPQLTTDEAYAACGPAAAVRFAQAEGRNPTLREATDLAKSVGWTSASGMAGLQSEKALMDKLQIPTRVVSGAAWDAFSREAQTGNPVTISTPGHFFFADGFNPDTGAFHVGQSGLDLKGGAEWMTPAQMTARMGPVQGGLLADNPNITNPSTVMGANQPADRQDRADASANNQPSSTGNSALDWLGQQKDALASSIGNAASGVGTAVSGAVDAAGNALPDTSAILGSPQQSALATRLQDPNTAAQNPIGTARDINAGFTQAQNEMTTAINPARDVPVLGGLINQSTNPENYLLGGAGGGVAGQVAMGAGLAAAQAPLGSSPEDIAKSAALGGAVGFAPAVAKGVAAGAPKVLDTSLEALDRLRPPDVAFASTMSGPQQALNDARQAVADLAARFPKMSPGSLAASGPGKQLAALEADAAANPEKYVPRVEPAAPLEPAKPPANPFALATEPTPNHVPLTPDEAAQHLDDLSARYQTNDARIQELENQIAGKTLGTAGVVHPPGTVGWTDAEVIAYARQNGLNPYNTDGWPHMAGDASKIAQNRPNIPTSVKQTPAQARAELSQLRIENEQIAAAADHLGEHSDAPAFYKYEQPAAADLPWDYNGSSGAATDAAAANPTRSGTNQDVAPPSARAAASPRVESPPAETLTPTAPRAADTTGFQGFFAEPGTGKALGDSLLQHELTQAEARMAALRASRPEITDAQAAATPLGQQIERYRQNAQARGLFGPQTTSPSAVPAEPPPPTTPAVSSSTVPEYERISQQAVADVRAQAATRAAKATPPLEQFDAQGNLATPTAAAAPAAGPRQVAPVTRDQVAPQGPLSRVTQVVNSAFEPIENLPDGEVKDALKRYAAVVGGQSQGERVVADTAGRQIAESGPFVTAFGVPIDSVEAMQTAVRTKARADLNGVLQSNGLSEKTPEIASILHNITTPSAIRSNPFGNVVLGANTAIKGSLFGLSNMHNFTETVTAAAAGGPAAVKNYARAFLSPSFYDGVRYGSMAPDFNQAAMAGVSGLLHHGAGGSDVEKLSGVVTRAVIGGIGGAGAGYEESLRAGDKENALRNAVIGGVAGAGAGVAAPALFGSMFGRAVPLAKVTVFKQLTNGGMDDLQAAAAVNRSFGGLNYAQMGRSQTLQDAMRLMMTAPDWNEATVRQIGAAVTGKNSGYSAKLLAKAIGGSMITSELLSYVLNGHSTMDNEPGHQLEVQVGTDKTGKGVYMGFMPGNVQAYGNLIDKIAGNPAATATDLGSFTTGRLGVLPQLGIDAATGSEYIGGPKAKNALASAVSRAAPIGISSVAQGLERGASWQDLTASILAGPNLRYGSKVLRQAVAPPAPSIGRYAPRP